MPHAHNFSDSHVGTLCQSVRIFEKPMCGRYMTPEEADLERAWELTAPAGYRQSFNLAPSQHGPVVLPGDDGKPAIEMLVWGFQPHWAKRGWINARSETVFSSRAFASAAKRHRCLVPALGWYEWQGAKPPKQPWLFHRDGFTLFAFAGIWTAGIEDKPATYAVLTTEAAPAIASIHRRMPVVLDPADYLRWLAADCDQQEAVSILGNNRTDVAVYKVSSYVNKPANNDAECIRPIE
jgi:putative SOS response-associated peptidase YedK